MAHTLNQTKTTTFLTAVLLLTILHVSLAAGENGAGGPNSRTGGSTLQNQNDDRWIYNSEYLLLDVEMTTSAEMQATGPASYVDYVSTELNFFPRENDRQKILAKSYAPEPEFGEDSLLFRWDSPRDSLVEASIKNTVKIINNPMRVKDKVLFPLKEKLGEGIIEYTKPAKIIDVNHAIVSKASELASGEDDLMVVIDKIAAWTTQNIKYDLSSVTAEATQQASWVIENKVGVCDELTSLFISMLRSLGIPARFVSGISYTNSDLFAEKWGPHGWAEVYVPDHGWIPYDVTYGEYGFVDPTHITAKISLDAEKITTKYAWRSKDAKYRINDAKTTVRISDAGKELSPYIDLEVELYKGSVNFGSYNLVKATVHNKGSFYQPLDVYLSKTNKLTVLDNHKQHTLLKPYETRTLFWRIMVDPELEKEFIYTFPISVYTLGEVSQQVEFKAVKGGITISKNRMEDAIREMSGKQDIVYDTTIDLRCAADRTEYYLDETPLITCTIRNKGNTFLTNTTICAMNDNCIAKDIGINQEEQASFVITMPEPGLNSISVSVANDRTRQQANVEFSVTDKPFLRVAAIETPMAVGFKDEFSINFTIEKLSDSSPREVEASFRVGGVKKTFDIAELNQSQGFQLLVSGSSLDEGDNTIHIDVAYHDRLGARYEASGTSSITLNKLTPMQNVYVILRTIGEAIVGVFW